MKHFIYLIFCFLISISSFTMTSCSSSDDDDAVEEGLNGQLVGRWYHVKDVFDDGDVDMCGDKNCYWDFSETKVTVHDVMDIANGQSVSYSFNGKTLTIKGFPMYTVQKLTSSELVLFIDAHYMTQTIYFKR